MAKTVIVADVGGTTCRTGVVGPEGLLHYEAAPTPDTADEFFDQLSGQLLKCHAIVDEAPKFCTVSLPGPISRSDEGVIDGISVQGLEQPFMAKERLAFANPSFNSFEVRVLNDADAATLEAARIYAKDENVEPLLYLGIGTGIGSDIAQNYETLSHSAGIRSELTYMPLFKGPDGYLGVGDRANGTSISNIYGDGNRSVDDIHREGSHEIWNNIGADLGRAIAVVSPVFGLSQVVIGGSVGANCSDRLEAPLSGELEEAFKTIPKAISELPEVEFVTPEESELLGLNGCYTATLQRRLMD